MNLDELIGKVLADDEQSRALVAKASFQHLLARVFSDYEEDSAAELLLGILKVIVSSDHLASAAEWKLFNFVLGREYTYDQYVALTDYGSDPELVDAVDREIDAMDEESKMHAILLALCFITIDGEVTDSEKALLAKIIA